MTTAQLKNAKHIKTKEKFAGNQYGKITKGSKVDRYYSIQNADGSVICDEWFMTLNGARLAAKLVNLGLSEDRLNTIDCDSLAAKSTMMAKWAGLSVDGYLAKLASEVNR